MKNKIKTLLVALMALCLSTILFVGCGGGGSNNSIVKESSFSVSAFEIKIEKGETAQLFAGYDGGETQINFKSTDESVMTLVSTTNGVATITAVEEGVAYVEISVGSQKKTCKIIVFVSDYEIIFDREESEIAVWVNYDLFITATVNVDGKGTDKVVTWSVVSGDCEMTVDGNYAVFTPNKAGNVTVKATFADKAEKTFSFVVVDKAL